MPNTDLEKTAETTETTDIEFQETEVEEVSEDADTDSNDEEFSDSNDSEEEGETSTEPKEESDKSWKNEKNAESARIRREAEQKAAIKKARNEAIISILDGVNPYTQEKIEDDDDVEEYLTMKEIEKSGKDPLADYSRYLKEKAKEQKKSVDTTDWVTKDRADFAEKYPKVKIDDLLNDEMFRTFASGKVGTIPLTQVFKDFQIFEKKSEERAKKKAAQILANKSSTPGKLSTAKPEVQKPISEMTAEEFRIFDEKVQRGEIKLT